MVRIYQLFFCGESHKCDHHNVISKSGRVTSRFLRTQAVQKMTVVAWAVFLGHWDEANKPAGPDGVLVARACRCCPNEMEMMLMLQLLNVAHTSGNLNHE